MRATTSPSQTHAPAAPPKGPVAFAALRHRDYRSYFTLIMLSMMADNIEHVISYWVIYEAFQSPALAGFAVISHWMPFLLFSVTFGAMADRYDCRRIIQISQSLFIVASVAWAVLFLTGALQIWHAVILLIIHGMAGAIWMPASQMLIHDIVGGGHLQSAVRMSATGRQLGILLGPAVGGALLLTVGPSYGLLINAMLYVPLIIWLFLVPYTGHRDAGPSRARGGVGALEAIRVLREVAGNPTIIGMVALAGLAAVLVGNAYQAQMPGFAHTLGTDEVGLAYSALLAANAAGAVLGGFVLEGTGLLQPRARTAVICAALWCLTMIGFAAARSYPLALVLLFVAGVLFLAFSSMAQTLVQLLAPPEKRGRVIGLFNVAQNGLRVGSGATVGVLGSVIGIHLALGISASALLVLTLALGVFMAATRRAGRNNGEWRDE